MQFEWERYEGKRGVKPSVPAFSIRRSGQIAFNLAVSDKFGLDKFTHVILCFDRKTRHIGMEFTNDAKAPGAVPIKRGGMKGNDFHVSARSFLAYFKVGIPDHVGRSTSIHKSRGEGVFIYFQIPPLRKEVDDG